MIKYFFTTISAVFISAATIAQIPNPGFETWNNMGTYENPDGWSTMNNKTSVQEIYTATKGTPGSPGSSYLKLTSKTIGGGVVPGIAVSGRLDSMTMLPLSGVPFTQRPAAFGGKWQHMIFGNSQGFVSVLLTKWNASQASRDTIAHGISVLSGMAMAWANFSFNLGYKDSLQHPDSCLIVLRASGGIPANNEYLWTDNLAFTGTVVAYQPTVVATGLEAKTQDAVSFTLFPNPAQGEVHIRYDLAAGEKVSLQIVDIHGKVVRDVQASNDIGVNALTIETGKLAKGIYSVLLRSNKLVSSSKLIIE